jgi:DNA-directed RNA polymerase subunit RPC12/RpoP
MAKCPRCSHNISTPAVLDLQQWARLACQNCGSKLQAKAPRALAFAPLAASLPVLGMQGRPFAAVAVVLMFVVNAIVLLDFIQPQLRPRKHQPRPEVELNFSVSK